MQKSEIFQMAKELLEVAMDAVFPEEEEYFLFGCLIDGFGPSSGLNPPSHKMKGDPRADFTLTNAK